MIKFVFCHTDFFFFNDTATTEIYTLSLHDALPIYLLAVLGPDELVDRVQHPLALHDLALLREVQRRDSDVLAEEVLPDGDRKSTRLNSSHANISYAVFCLKKKKEGLALWRRVTLAA